MAAKYSLQFSGTATAGRRQVNDLISVFVDTEMTLDGHQGAERQTGSQGMNERINMLVVSGSFRPITPKK